MESSWKPLEQQTAASLLAVLRQDLAAIRKLDARLDEAAGEAMTDAGYKEMAAVAYGLHNLYNAL